MVLHIHVFVEEGGELQFGFILSIKSFICLQLHYKRFEKFDESFRVFFIPLKQVIFRRF